MIANAKIDNRTAKNRYGIRGKHRQMYPPDEQPHQRQIAEHGDQPVRKMKSHA